MKKALFVAKDYLFYKNKFDGQMNALQSKGYQCFFYSYEAEMNLYHFFAFDAGECTDLFSTNSKWSGALFEKYMEQSVCGYIFDLIYIRRLGLTLRKYGHILRKWNKEKVSIFYEIPTYPFENRGTKENIKQCIEKILYYKAIIPNVQAIPVYCYDSKSKLLSKMLPVENCVDVNKFKKINLYNIPKFDGTRISLLGIAHYQKWHAYDRLIQSLDEFKKKIQMDINFTIYGNFNFETANLKKWVEIRNIDFVNFLEEKDVCDKAEFFSQFHVGVGCLGIHRKDNLASDSLLDTSIKNKEYCAMGIPFIHSSKDVSFRDDFKYHYIVESGEKEIDFNKILTWYSTLRENKNIKNEMYIYACKNLSFTNWANKILNAKNM